MSDAACIDELLEVLRGVLPRGAADYQLHEPELGMLERDRILEALDEGFVSYAGRHVTLLEEALAQRCGVKAAVAMVSGTVALHALLHALEIGAGDEVLCPSLTFVATANAIVHAGAVPHFVDCSADDLGIDAERLDRYLEGIATQDSRGLRNRRTGRRIAALMPVHVFGHVGDLQGLRAVAERWGLPVIEDSTEALGSQGANGLLFRAGIASTLSFNGNKIVTTGGGGAILTDDVHLAARLKHLTTTAKQAHPWRFFHDEVGFNYRLPNLNAALGLAQMARLDDFVARKRRLAGAYRRAFANARLWRFFDEPKRSTSNFWLNVVVAPEADEPMLEQAFAALHADGYRCRPCWTPMHKLPIHAGHPRDELPVTEDMAARIVCLPSSPRLVDSVVG